MPPPPPPPPPPVEVGAARIEVLRSLPRASGNRIYEKPCLSNGSLSYQRIYNRLSAILDERGYADRRRFLTPRGFGIATRFERIADDGKPLSADRWNVAPFYNSAWTILTGKARPGRYRSFIITYGMSLPERNKPSAYTDLQKFSSDQDVALPDKVRARLGGGGDHVDVFIYEYARPALRQKAALAFSVQPAEHLARSGLGPRLNSICTRHE